METVPVVYMLSTKQTAAVLSNYATTSFSEPEDKLVSISAYVSTSDYE